MLETIFEKFRELIGSGFLGWLYAHNKISKNHEYIGCNRKEIKVKLEESKRK